MLNNLEELTTKKEDLIQRGHKAQIFIKHEDVVDKLMAGWLVWENRGGYYLIVLPKYYDEFKS